MADVGWTVPEAMASAEFAAHFAGFEWPWYMPTVDAYRALAEQSGWQTVEVWGENADRYFPDEATMIRWVDQPSLVPFQKHVSGLDWAAFRGFVVRRMIEETRQDDGTCFERLRRVNADAAIASLERER
jgi:trans-aconitate 2-methyltransferase